MTAENPAPVGYQGLILAPFTQIASREGGVTPLVDGAHKTHCCHPVKTLSSLTLKSLCCTDSPIPHLLK